VDELVDSDFEAVEDSALDVEEDSDEESFEPPESFESLELESDEVPLSSAGLLVKLLFFP